MLALLLAVAFTQPQIHDQCIYQAGVARAVQEIRHEGDSWEQFEVITRNIYKDDEGYKNVLAIGYLVFHQVPIVYNSSEVFELIYDTCVTGHYRKHKEGPEFLS